jgi:hypothetical protein
MEGLAGIQWEFLGEANLRKKNFGVKRGEGMISDIAYTIIFSKPLIFWLGLLAYFLLVSAALIAVLNKRGKRFIAFKWHSRIALLGLLFASIHALFGLSVYFNF